MTTQVFLKLLKKSAEAFEDAQEAPLMDRQTLWRMNTQEFEDAQKEVTQAFEDTQKVATQAFEDAQKEARNWVYRQTLMRKRQLEFLKAQNNATQAFENSVLISRETVARMITKEFLISRLVAGAKVTPDEVGLTVYFTTDKKRWRGISRYTIKQGMTGVVVGPGTPRAGKSHRTIRVKVKKALCKECDGSGKTGEFDHFERAAVKCDACDGTGKRDFDHELNVKPEDLSRVPFVDRRRLVEHARTQAKDEDTMSPSELVLRRRRLAYGARVSPALAALMDEIEAVKRN